MHLTNCWPGWRHDRRRPGGKTSKQPLLLVARLGFSSLAVVLLAGCMDSYHESVLKADLNLLKGICEKYGAGETIYRVVEGVQGVFQVKVRNPYPNWRDQFGLDEPWGVAFERDTPVLLKDRSSAAGDKYWFYEQQPPWGSPRTDPYRRTVLTRTGQRPTDAEIKSGERYLDADGYVAGVITIRTRRLKSKYGWTTEDLTTQEMRKHWISGVRLKVMSLETQEILAERVDFYRATGPAVKLAWSAGVSCGNPSLGYGKSRFIAKHNYDFITLVLRPTSARPTVAELNSLGEE